MTLRKKLEVKFSRVYNKTRSLKNLTLVSTRALSPVDAVDGWQIRKRNAAATRDNAVKVKCPALRKNWQWERGITILMGKL